MKITRIGRMVAPARGQVGGLFARRDPPPDPARGPAASRGIIPARMEPLVSVPTLPGAPFRLPPQFEGLRRLAYNLWWMWHPRAALLFQRIDADDLVALPQPDRPVRERHQLAAPA